LLVNRNPVGVAEVGMSLDVSHAVLHVTKPLGDVNLKQIFDQVAKVGAEMRRKLDLCRTTNYDNSTLASAVMRPGQRMNR
jgi:hypothetical protein